jgi:hypothetical protein
MREHKVEMRESVVISSEVYVSIVHYDRVFKVPLMPSPIAVDYRIAVPIVEVHIIVDVPCEIASH